MSYHSGNLVVPNSEDRRRRSRHSRHSHHSRDRRVSSEEPPRTGRAQDRSRSRRLSPEEPPRTGRLQDRPLSHVSPERKPVLETTLESKTVHEIGQSQATGILHNTEEFPQSSDEARQHIDRIRNEKLASAQGWMARSYRNILKESTRVYSDTTRFLYELIQNADDNNYDNGTPSICVTYNQIHSRRTLQIDCNEIGFTRANVDAICSLSESSKSKPDSGRHYIGEKGMGFKSVFAVSDAAYIRSGFYSFKFLNNSVEPLSMVTPCWEEVPAEENYGQTSILLELATEISMEGMTKSLKGMDPTILLFLNRLARIEIKLIKNQDVEHVTLSRQIEDSVGYAFEFVTVCRGTQSARYTTFCRNILIAANDDRRKDRSGSQLLIAFPSESSFEHHHDVDNTEFLYAFLPIRSYGLKFIVHADFILVQNRQDLVSSPWNTEIVGAIPAAFLEAVNSFNSAGGSLRYSWLRYVPLPKDTSVFDSQPFRKLPGNLIDLLSNNPVLEDQEGHFTLPCQLTCVPDEYRDQDGKPLVPNVSSNSRHISDEYSSENRDIMFRLRVQKTSPEDFLLHLGEFISKDHEAFQRRPPSWHIRLSKTLLALINTDSEDQNRKELIMGMRIVHLQDGEWIAPRSGSVFFPSLTKGLAIPKGTTAFAVHINTASDPSCKTLLQVLGVKEYHTQDICDVIIQDHMQPDFKPDDIFHLDLMSHIEFLIRAEWRPRRTGRIDLWFMAEDGARRQGSTLYIRTEAPYSATEIFYRPFLEEASEPFVLSPVSKLYPVHFLHRDYAQALPYLNKNWIEWLSENLGLATIPRMVTPHLEGEPFTIVDDFKLIVENEASSKILLVLREHWHYYKKWVVPEEGKKARQPTDVTSARQLREYLSCLRVTCKNGTQAQLSQTILPRQDVLLALGYVQGESTQSQPSQDIQSATAPQEQDLLGLPLRSEIREFTYAEPKQMRVSRSQMKLDGHSRSERSSKDWSTDQVTSESYNRLHQNKHSPELAQRVFSFAKSRLMGNQTYLSGTATSKRNAFTMSSADAAFDVSASEGVSGDDRAREKRRERRRHRSRERHTGAEATSRDRYNKRDRHKDRTRYRSLSRHKSLDRKRSPDKHRKRERGKSSARNASPDQTEHAHSTPEIKFSSHYEEEKHRTEFLLDVPDPEVAGWDFLECLGVAVKMKAEVFVDRLRQLRNTIATKEQVALLYEKIEKSVHELGAGTLSYGFLQKNAGCANITSKIFTEENLIFWAPSQPDEQEKWVSLADCVWKGPRCLKSTLRLSEEYLEQSYLFERVLKCKRDADMSTLVTEARLVGAEDPLERIAGLLIAISREVEQKDPKDLEAHLRVLVELRMFPTTKVLGKPGFQSLETAMNSSEWFIPDDFRLANIFQPNLSFLACDFTTISHLGPLFDALVLQPRRLSNASNESSAAAGSRKQNPAYREWLDTRLGYVKGLIPPKLIHEGVFSKLQQMAVFQTERVETTWAVKKLDGTVCVKSKEHGSSFMHSTAAGDHLELFLLSTDSEPGYMPPEVVIQLSRLCAIEGEQSSIILCHILSDQPLDRIEKYLERQGVPFDKVDMKQIKSPNPGTKPSLSNQFKDMMDGYLAVSSSTAFNSRTDDNMVYLGELYVSDFLKRVLGNGYVPNNHWLSPLRIADGHAIYRDEGEEYFRFRFTDTTARFSQFLYDNGVELDKDLSKPRTFHIAVYPTHDTVKSTFTLDYDHYERIRAFMDASDNISSLSDLPIIFRVANIYGSTEVAMYVDPYHTLSLEPPYSYKASFQGDARPIVVQPFSKGETGIYIQGMNPSTHIRLIELFPGDLDEPLEGALHTIPISNPGTFWALSYVWAGSLPLVDYYFRTRDGRVSITPSLALALKKIRARGQSVRVWADAISINQSNSLEKGRQIPLMGAIYHSAERVFAWLGPEDYNSPEAMALLSRINNSQDTTISSSNRSRPLEILNAGEGAWAGINQLLASTWFTRVWIVQELIFGSNVFLVCGDLEMKWEDFFSAISVCAKELHQTNRKRYELLFKNSYPALALATVRHSRRTERQTKPLLELLELFWYTKATKEEDKLFALWALSSEVHDKAFIPEYGPSPESAIRQYAAGFIKGEKTVMELLYRSGMSKSYDFCSWIPSWTRGSFPRTIFNWECAGKHRNFRAGRNLPPQACLKPSDPNVLVVQGFLVDTITSVTEISLGTASFVTWVKALVDFRGLISSLGDEYPTGETLQELVFRLPIGNAKRPYLEADEHVSVTMIDETPRDSKGNEKDVSVWPEDLASQLLSICVHQDPNQYEQRPKEVRDWIEKYWETVAVFSKRLGDAKFCTTWRGGAQTGYAGLVPGWTEVGDLLCLLHGGCVPFVLRKSETGYRLVGECYIHGIMNGEGLLLSDDQNGSESREFELH